jgi:hypothetical protein
LVHPAGSNCDLRSGQRTSGWATVHANVKRRVVTREVEKKNFLIFELVLCFVIFFEVDTRRRGV